MKNSKFKIQNSKFKIQNLFLILISLFLWSCNECEDIGSLNSANPSSNQEIMQLGQKLQNPYSVSNMKLALQNLQNTSKISSINGVDNLVTPTHLYVKYKPKNEQELTLLKKDTLVNYYPFPLDYEIVGEGDTYRDPAVVDGQPTYQYAAIKVGHALPQNVDYEILEQLFIPDEEKEDYDVVAAESEEEITYQQKIKKLNVLVQSSKEDLIDDLVEEAFRITNNNLESSSQNEELGIGQEKSQLSLRRREWVPKGTIRMHDDVLGVIGVEGLKVRALRWFTTHVGFTNSNGEFRCDGDFRGEARYLVDWERHQFALRSALWVSAEKTGPHKRGDWNWFIEDANNHNYYATIFRAAYHYYYKNIKGLTRPPLNGEWDSQLRIRAVREKNGSTKGDHLSFRRLFGLGEQIYIYDDKQRNYEIYATTIHELAHAVHWKLEPVKFNIVQLKVAESWARGVQWELTKMVYSNYKPSLNKGHYRRGSYTGVVEDLIDGVVEKKTSYYYTEDGINIEKELSYKDEVSGYTINQIEYALKNAVFFYQWRDNIKEQNNNPTKNKVDEAFRYWDTH